MYNSGQSKLHYYQGFVTFNAGAHRLQVGYGRTRAALTALVAYVAISQQVKVLQFHTIIISKQYNKNEKNNSITNSVCGNNFFSSCAKCR